FGLSLGYERLNYLVNRTISSEETPIDYPDQPTEEKVFPPGTKVIRVRPNKTSKLDTTFNPELYVVISGFNNGTYQLADMQGRLLKRRVNKSTIRRFHERRNTHVTSSVTGG
ncbi:hypothetical protein CLU79DRAFT_707354, partial [Phycomyces nitens]